MCRLHTEGVQYGCGHYVVTDRLSKDDCSDQFCMNSDMHPEGRCSGCGETCKRYYEPDATQHVIDNTTAYCTLCHYWFKGAGAKRGVNPVAPAGAAVIRPDVLRPELLRPDVPRPELLRPNPHALRSAEVLLDDARPPNPLSPAGGTLSIGKQPPQPQPQPKRRQIRQP